MQVFPLVISSSDLNGVIWLIHCWYGVKHKKINQLIQWSVAESLGTENDNFNWSLQASIRAPMFFSMRDDFFICSLSLTKQKLLCPWPLKLPKLMHKKMLGFCFCFVLFFQVCETQTYGPGCLLSCGNCSNREPCHHVNGTCLYGCNEGVQGGDCKIGQ